MTHFDITDDMPAAELLAKLDELSHDIDAPDPLRAMAAIAKQLHAFNADIRTNAEALAAMMLRIEALEAGKPTPASNKPITLELEPSELWLLAKYAFKYLDTDNPPRDTAEALLATRLIDANARYLTAMMMGKP